MVGLDDLKALFPPKQFYNSMILQLYLLTPETLALFLHLPDTERYNGTRHFPGNCPH